MAKIYWKVSGTTLYLRNDSATGYSAWTESANTSPAWSTNTNRGKIVTINIQNSITPTYFYRWFNNFIKLQTITNWDNLKLTNITSMDFCFTGCTSFNQLITIPEGVTSMSGCFTGCTSFNQLIPIPDSVEEMDSCFSNCTSFNQPIEIPSGVTNMSWCFNGCTSFNKLITIPDSVVYMSRCFSYCTSFNQPIIIPNGVEDMSGCFGGCESFNQSIIIPDSVIDMEGCFSSCTSFNKLITIPDSVNNISGCFLECTSLTGIIEINASINEFDNYELCFDGTTREIILCRSNDNDISPTAEQLQHYADTCNYNNVKVGKLALVLKVERDDDNQETIKISATINRFRYGELSSLNLYKDDSLISTTWTPSSLTIDTNNKVFETTINNVDENSIVNIKVEAIDGYSSIEKTVRVGKSYHTIDILAGGKEIAFGSSAKETDLHAYNRLSQLPADFHTDPGKYYMKTNTGEFKPFPYDPPWSDEQIIDYGVYEYEEYHDSLFKCSMDADFEEPVAFKKASQIFVVEEYEYSFSAISSGGVLNWSAPKTKTGYYPVGVVGFRTNMQALVVNMAKLSSVQSGSCTINMNARAVANVPAGTAQMYVLWIKEI